MSKFADTSQDSKESAGLEAWTQILQLANITSTQTEYLLEEDKRQKDMENKDKANNHSAAQVGASTQVVQQQENLNSSQQQLHSSLQPSFFFGGPFPFGCIRVPFGGTPGDEFGHNNSDQEENDDGTELEFTSNNFESTATTSFSVPASLDPMDGSGVSEKQPEDLTIDCDNNFENGQIGNNPTPKSSKNCQNLHHSSSPASSKTSVFASATTEEILMIPKTSLTLNIKGPPLPPKRMEHFSHFLLPAEFASSDVCRKSNRRNDETEMTAAENTTAAFDQNPQEDTLMMKTGEDSGLLEMDPFVSRFKLAKLNRRIPQEQQPSSDSELILPRSASQTSNVPIALQQIGGDGGGESPAQKQKLSPSTSPPHLTIECSNLWIEDEPPHFNTVENGADQQFLQTSPFDYYQSQSGEIKDVEGGQEGDKEFGNQEAETDGFGHQQLSKNDYETINTATFDVDATKTAHSVSPDPPLQGRMFRRRHQFPPYSPTNNTITCPNNNNKHPLSEQPNLNAGIKNSNRENAKHCKTAEVYSNENPTSLQRASDFSIGFPDQDAVPDLASLSKANATDFDSNSTDKNDSFPQLTAIEPSTINSSSFPTAIEPMQTIDSSSVHGSSSNNNLILKHQGSSDNTKKSKKETTEAQKAKKAVYYLYNTESNNSRNHCYFPTANGGIAIDDIEENERDWGIKELEPVDEQSSSDLPAASQSIDSDGKKASRRSTEVENRREKSSFSHGREAAWWGIANFFTGESVRESEGWRTLLATAAETSSDRRQTQILRRSKDSDDDTSFQPILSVHHTRSPVRRSEEKHTKSAVNEPRPPPGGISNEPSIGRPPLLSEYCLEDLESEYTLVSGMECKSSSAYSSTPGVHNIDNNDGKEGVQTIRKSVISCVSAESLPPPAMLLSEYCYKDLESEYSVHQLESSPSSLNRRQSLAFPSELLKNEEESSAEQVSSTQGSSTDNLTPKLLDSRHKND